VKQLAHIASLENQEVNFLLNMGTTTGILTTVQCTYYYIVKLWSKGPLEHVVCTKNTFILFGNCECMVKISKML